VRVGEDVPVAEALAVLQVGALDLFFRSGERAGEAISTRTIETASARASR
jgi:hypothetical protein